MPTKTDTKPDIKPFTLPDTEPERRYDPEEDHCPSQRVRTVRRGRRVVTE